MSIGALAIASEIGQALGRDLVEDGIDLPFVPGDQLPLRPPLGGVAEQIEGGATEKLQPCKNLQRRLHPLAERALAGPAAGIGLCRDERRGQMVLHLEIAFELAPQFVKEIRAPCEGGRLRIRPCTPSA